MPRRVTILEFSRHVPPRRCVMTKFDVAEWSAMPLMLKVDEAAAVLRVSRSKAYEMTTLYDTSGGTAGLPCLRMGDVLRVPRFALEEFVTSGRVVQLLHQPAVNPTVRATPARKPSSRATSGR